MTNTNRDLHKRLLQLLPIKIVKDGFNEKGHQDDVVEAITGNYPQQKVRDFFFEHFMSTKQNIYIYELSKNFQTGNFDLEDFPFKIESEERSGNTIKLFCLPKTAFSVYLNDPPTVEELVFFQPLMVEIIGKLVIIHYVKLEKNVQSYFPIERQPKKASAENEEEETLEIIVEFFNEDYNISKADLNAGVKYLWEVDDVDCTRIQFRKQHSISLETMDGKETFKNKYPNEYTEIIKKPLGKSNWKYQRNDGYFCAALVIDPSSGEISIPKFPDDPNQIKNVITKILANN